MKLFGQLTVTPGQIWDIPYRGICMIDTVDCRNDQVLVLREKDNELILLWFDVLRESTLIG